MKRRILVVPGFVVDTYSEIERSYVELCASPHPDIEFLWLASDISSAVNSFRWPENRAALKEPVYVPRLRERGIPYVVAKISRFNGLANLRLFRKLLNEHRVDAVYTHFGFERFWAALCAKLLGRVTIWNEHWYSMGTRYVRAKRLFYRLCVDDFIAVSRFIAGTLPQGCRVHVVPNAIRAAGRRGGPRESCAELRRRLGIPAERTIVLMVAGFRPEKRHALALHVCRAVLAARDDVAFVFVGDGATRPAFLERVAGLGLGGRVIAPGHVVNVEDYYAAADICMLTSHREPFGYCVLEAMREGLPMVAFDGGGPAEVIRHGETGFLVQEQCAAAFARKILDLVENPAERRRVGAAGRRAVAHAYDRDAWIRTLNRTLRDIVIGHDAGSTAAGGAPREGTGP